MLFLFLSLIQTTFACEVREHELRTHLNMPYIAILPKNFDPQKTYGVVYFLHGRGGDRHSLLSLGACEELDRLKEPFIIIAPEGKLSYWMNGAYTHERWGEMVTKDLRESVEKNYLVRKTPQGRVIAGISMGGHGAVQLSLNYPGIYGAIGAHSAVFRTEQEAARDFYYEFGQGIEYQKRDPISLVKQGKTINASMYLDMGGRDPWLSRTLAFEQLIKNKVKGEFNVGTDVIGGHEEGYWKYHLKNYFNWYAKQLLTNQ